MECNSNCGCQSVKYDPVCYEPLGLTYYSACHAGCTASFIHNDIKVQAQAKLTNRAIWVWIIACRLLSEPRNGASLSSCQAGR